MRRIVVIGAGVIGASVAAELAERGDDVTLVDRGAPGGGTSSTSFGWLNANGKAPEAYFELNRLGLDAHRALAGPGGAWLGEGGHVEIAVDPLHRERLEARVAFLAQRDYPVELLDVAQATDLLPGIRIPRDAERIAHFPSEGYAFPLLYVAHALERLRSAGGGLRTGSAVVGIQPAGGGTAVRLADGSVLPADAVVVAAGRWTSAVAALAGADVPMRGFSTPGDATVGYLVETAPAPVRLSHIVTTPELNVRPAGGGRLLLQALDLDADADPAHVPDPDAALGREFARRLSAVAFDGAAARIERIVVGQRALPEDGRTIAGFTDEAPAVYVVATHSGVTLAPYLGSAVADEIRGVDHPELSGFRPSRFRLGTPYDAAGVARRPGEQ